MGSNPIPLALSLVAVTLLIVLVFMKERVLTTLELGQNPSKEGSDMEKAKMYAKYMVVSVAEVASALGASLVALVGPLA